VASAPPVALKPVARVTHPPIDEMSGIVKSRRYPGIFWVQNDSGDSARLFAVRANGNVVLPPFLVNDFSVDETAILPGAKPVWPGITVDGATNSDWEDLATDGDNLYLADVGNNGNARRDLGVFVLPEPNPQAVERARAVKWLHVAYPDQTAFPGDIWRFDCEAVFFFRGKLHFLTKHRISRQIGFPENGTNLYRLDTQYTDRVNVLKKLDGLSDLGGWVTSADVSPDGKTLAVLCHMPVSSVWLFDVSGSGDRMLSTRPARRLVFTGAQQCEAVCWESDASLMVTNEQRDIFRLNVRDFRPVTPAATGR
jgi:hypothetical protein